MISVSHILQKDLPTLAAHEDPNEALNLMDQYHVSHLPVIENGKYLGLISESTLLEADPDYMQHAGAEFGLFKLSVKPEMHWMEVLRMASENQLTLVPVTNAENDYLGCITTESLIGQICEALSADKPGGFLVIEMWSKDYSMQQIARIIEENDAKILSLSMLPGEDGRIELHIKLNKPEINAILQSLERFGYFVKASFQEQVYTEELRRRFDELMRYLNL
ncbi:MAG: CBS domain-containing protein [Flavobacteriales bacterium]